MSVVPVGVGVAVQVLPPVPATQRVDQQAESEPGDQEATGYSQPRQHDRTGQRCRYRKRQTEHQDPGGMGSSNSGTYHHGVSGRALPTGDVGSHHGLSVTG